MKREACLLLSAAALLNALPAQAQVDLGGIVNKAGAAVGALRGIDEPQEIALGSELSGIVLGAAPLIRDPARQRYINRLGMWLAIHSERPGLPWKFGIIDSDDFNAFSMPGGTVLISRGLLSQMRNESELAGVLAHEIAHVVKKHHLDALQKEVGTGVLSDIGRKTATEAASTATTAATSAPATPPPTGIKRTALGAVRLARDAATQAIMVTGRVLEGSRQVLLRGLDKDDEYEADRMAVVIAARAGYSPYGLVGVLQTLSGEAEIGRFALMSKTHPKPADRIEQLDLAMGTKFDAITGLVDDLPGFAAMRDRRAAPQSRRPRKAQ